MAGKQDLSQHSGTAESEAVEMPRPTVAPVVLSLGLVLAACGVATSYALMLVGGLLVVFGMGLWIEQLLPGRGHEMEPLVEPARRAQPVMVKPGMVESLVPGRPGYRF